MTDDAGVVLPQSANPRASIIVLAWRLTDGLLQCLRSVADSVDAPDFEVVVVLNGADPAVREVVAERVTGAVVVDLDANVGFGGGCNAGARVARGQYLVLLNDDTVVEPDWLRQLVDSADRSTEVVAVGSVLLNEDGTLQEAGSRVLPDAGTVQIGKGMSVAAATAAGYLEPRSVDYVSGAALLIRRSAFEKVGGFDPIFEPAYFEDVDLCFRLRRAGGDIRLEPTSLLRHASGGSTRVDPRLREFAGARSGLRFIARWAATLAAAPQREAPLSRLCDPGLSPDPGPGGLAHVSNPAVVAAEIARDYQAWLNQALDRAVEEVLVERALRGSDPMRIVELEISEREARAALDDLARRGPLGFLRWRIGLIIRRRASIRAIGLIEEPRPEP